MPNVIQARFGALVAGWLADWLAGWQKTIELLRKFKDFLKNHQKQPTVVRLREGRLSTAILLNAILKSVKKPCVFEGQDDGLRCGRIGEPAQPGGERAGPFDRLLP